MKVVIVGYDPGTTAALAVIDSKKNVLLIDSRRYMKKKELLELISEHGKPIIVAGDRFPLPKSVDKLASSFSCKSFYPEGSLSTSEKWMLTNEYSDSIKNDHERDALASALKAFEKYSSLFKKVDRTLSYIGLNEYYDRVLSMLISEKADNVTDAINKILDEVRKKKEQVIKRKRTLPRKKSELERRLKTMENDISILKKYNETLKKRLKMAENKIKSYQEKEFVESDEELRRAVSNLKRQLKEKESLIDTLKTIRKIEHEGYIPVLELKEVRTSAIDDLNEKIGLQNTVLMVDDFKNVQALNDYYVGAVISSKEPNDRVLSSVNFPIIHGKSLNIEKMDSMLAVKRDEFEENLKNAKKKGFVGWLRGHKKRKL